MLLDLDFDLDLNRIDRITSPRASTTTSRNGRGFGRCSAVAA